MLFSTENASQDFDCGRDIKGLADNVCNEVARLPRDYPSQSNIICEETIKLAVALVLWPHVTNTILTVRARQHCHSQIFQFQTGIYSIILQIYSL